MAGHVWERESLGFSINRSLEDHLKGLEKLEFLVSEKAFSIAYFSLKNPPLLLQEESIFFLIYLLYFLLEPTL